MVQQKLQEENLYLEGKVKEYEVLKAAAGQTVSDATHFPATEQDLEVQ